MQQTKQQQPKTVLITGANRGIGLEMCRQLQAQGQQVTAVCRSSNAELDALGVQVIDQCDVADQKSVQQLVQKLGNQHFDVVINNAGILNSNTLGEIDYSTVMQQFQVNAMAPLMVTEALLGHLKPAAKVAIVTSRMGSIADNDSGGHYGYRMSKAAVNMAGTSLAVDLKPKGIAVGLLHPGYVKTDMTSGQGHVDAAHAAQGLLARIDELNLSNSGSFWHAEGEQLPW